MGTWNDAKQAIQSSQEFDRDGLAVVLARIDEGRHAEAFCELWELYRQKQHATPGSEAKAEPMGSAASHEGDAYDADAADVTQAAES